MSTLPYNPDAFNTPDVEVSPLSVKTYFPNSQTPIGTWSELWFGSGSHLDPGYKSTDPGTIAAQVAAIKQRGFDFVILDWYGTQTQPQHNAALLWISECEKQGLQFIIDYNKGIFQFNVPSGVGMTIWGTGQMDFAVKHFCASPSYMKAPDGRFLMVNFDCPSIAGLDMKKILADYPQVAMLYVHSGGVSKPLSAGCFGWVGLDPANPEGCIEAYQTAFLTAAAKAKAANPKMIVMGSVCKGFDDHGRRAGLDPTKSCWNQSAPYRFADEKQGQTFLNVVAAYNASVFKPDLLFIPTHNDYEENTATSERGIDSQVTVSLSASLGVLTLALAGNLNAVDHVELFVNGEVVWSAAPATTLTFDLSSLSPVGVQAFDCHAIAVGKPLFPNKASNTVSTTATIVPAQTQVVDVPVHIDTAVIVSVAGTASGLTVQGSVSVPVQKDVVVKVTAIVTTQTIWS